MTKWQLISPRGAMAMRTIFVDSIMVALSNATGLDYHVNISCFMVNMIKARATVTASTARSLRIAILAYDGCMGAQLFGMAEVLRIANDLAQPPGQCPPEGVHIHLVGVGNRAAGVVRIAGGTPIGVQRPRGRYDLLVVPGLEITRQVDWNAKLAPLSRELVFIRKTFATGTPVASVCVGAFLLGEAGLLNGRRATTAWLFAADLAKRYPAAKVQADAILLEDGAVTSTGAVSSAFDLAIHLVKRILGAELATATARVALLPSQRVSQAPYVDARLLPRSLPTFSEHVLQWFEQRLSDAFDLGAVAQAFHVSPSTLMRRVKSETGQSPLALLQQVRVDRAKQLLSGTAWSVARITESVGYSDVASFSRLFTRLVGETPAKYRRR